MLSVLPSIGASTTLEIARSIAIAELNCANRLFGKSRCPSDADSVKWQPETTPWITRTTAKDSGPVTTNQPAAIENR